MKKTKLIAIVLSLCMLLALVPVAALAAEFTDADEVSNESYADAIDRWADEGVIKGNADGSFNPKGTMPRVQGFGIIAELLNLTEKADLSEYTDVPTDGWKADYLAKVVAAGIVTGYPDKTLRPDDDLTREQMFVTIAKTLGIQPVETDDEEFEDIGEAADYAAPYINALHKMGAVNGSNGNVNPLETLSREGAALLLDNLIGGYANTEGETVEIEKGKITLVVADNVAVKGEVTEEDMPIVVAGQAGTVDMKEVTGDVAPTVNVTVPEVKIENAPVGTTVAAAEDVADVTVNDQTVEAGGEVVVEEEEQPAPSIPVYTPNNSTSETTIDDIIEAGRVEVNAKMVKDNAPYAFIPEFEKTGTREVKVMIYDGTVQVGTVYSHIIDTLVNALVANAGKVTSITADTSIDGNSVADGTAGKTLTLSSTVSNNDVVQFVKACVGSSYTGGSTISTLVGKDFTVTVSDSGKDDVTTTVSYKVTFTAPSLDEVIGARIDSIGAAMSYASLKWSGTDRTLTVNITNDSTTVAEVYRDIGKMLCNAFNAAKSNITEVKDALNTSAQSLGLSGDLTDSVLAAYVKGLKVISSTTPNDGAKDLDTVVTPSSSGVGNGTIGTLKGYQFEINVTSGGTTTKYIIKFVGETLTLDEVIEREIETIDAKMSYADLDWTTGTHTLAVTINDSSTEIGAVYNDIAGMLCSAFNKCRTTLSSVEDSLFPSGGQGTKSTLSPSQDALTESSLLAFVKGLYLTKDGSTATSLLDVLKGTGDAASRTSLISHLDGYSFKINVTAAGDSASAQLYTISFTVQAA